MGLVCGPLGLPICVFLPRRDRATIKSKQKAEPAFMSLPKLPPLR